jgi:hypothetical protein
MGVKGGMRIGKVVKVKLVILTIFFLGPLRIFGPQSFVPRPPFVDFHVPNGYPYPWPTHYFGNIGQFGPLQYSPYLEPYQYQGWPLAAPIYQQGSNGLASHLGHGAPADGQPIGEKMEVRFKNNPVPGKSVKNRLAI